MGGAAAWEVDRPIGGYVFNRMVFQSNLVKRFGVVRQV